MYIYYSPQKTKHPFNFQKLKIFVFNSFCFQPFITVNVNYGDKVYCALENYQVDDSFSAFAFLISPCNESHPNEDCEQTHVDDVNAP